MAEQGDDDHQKRRRAFQLALARLRELVDARTPIARRSRTLSPAGAIAECCALARAKVRAGGVTRPSADPKRAGHNVAMLPDVVREAVGLLRADQVLKRGASELGRLLCADLERLSNDDLLNEEAILKVEALGEALRRTYLTDALDALQAVATTEPRELFAVEEVCDSVVAELRARGWSDTSLREAFSPPFSDIHRLLEGLKTLDRLPQPLPCYVAVTVTTHRSEIEESGRVTFVDALPGGVVRGPAPVNSGPFARIEVDALDYRYAAEAAYSQIASVLGAAAVFVKTDILVRSSTVVVETPTGPFSIDAHLRIPRESRRAKPGQLARIVRSAADAAAKRTVDSIFDAIRHRQRALETSDLESRFMLLWLGIERLCLGSPDHSTILESVRCLVSPAIALGKLRREMDSLRRYLARAAATKGGKEARSLEQLLELIRDSNPTALTSEFYDTDVLATQWVARLQKDLRSASGEKVAAYFERSRERVEWQVLRLYRARNSVAHAARGPAWLTDLVLHAHFYLTQLIAICVEHRDQSADQAAAEILLQRSAQYHSFLALLKAESRRALDTASLLRPTSLVGPATQNPS